MKLKDVKTDFHVTGWTVEVPPKNELKRRILTSFDAFPKSLVTVANTLYNNEENRAIFLLNYYQPKYENLITGLKDAEKEGYQINSDHKDTFIGLTKNDKNWLYIIRGFESMCRQGHIIVAGTSQPVNHVDDRYMTFNNGPDLEETLKYAEAHDALVIVPHPMPEFGLPAKAVLRVLNETSGTKLGLDRETIEKNVGYIDALEKYSLSMSQVQTEKTKILARDLNIPTVVGTDNDKLKEVLSSYNSIDEIDFSSPEAMRGKLRDSLKNHKYHSVIKPVNTPLQDKVEHILINVLQHRRNF